MQAHSTAVYSAEGRGHCADASIPRLRITEYPGTDPARLPDPARIVMDRAAEPASCGRGDGGGWHHPPPRPSGEGAALSQPAVAAATVVAGRCVTRVVGWKLRPVLP